LVITFIYAYDILPGKSAEFAEWARKVGLPFWLKQPEVKSLRLLLNFFGAADGVAIGSPQRAIMMDFESMADFEKIGYREETKKVAAEFHTFVKNVKTYYFTTTVIK